MRATRAPGQNQHRKTHERHASAASAGEQPMRAVASLALHSETAIVPAMSRAEYKQLCADVGRRGIVTPLDVTSRDVLLDGRSRLRAALGHSLEHVPVRVVEPEDEVEYMVLAAIQRRNLTPSQRAALS